MQHFLLVLLLSLRMLSPLVTFVLMVRFPHFTSSSPFPPGHHRSPTHTPLAEACGVVSVTCPNDFANYGIVVREAALNRDGYDVASRV